MKFVFGLCFLFIFILISSIRARDIDLDTIYIDHASRVYDKLKTSKLAMYRLSLSRYIGSNVIFADWINGYEIVFIKEIKNLNIIYNFNRKNFKVTEIYRITGTVTTAIMSNDENHLVLKCLKLIGSRPVSQLIVFNIKNKRISYLHTDYPFRDFTLSPSGKSIFYNSKRGIVEYDLEQKKRTIIFKKRRYKELIKANSQVIPHVSPNRRSLILVSGTAGEYRAKLFSRRSATVIRGVSSATELYWIDNRKVIYRRGRPGRYSVYLYDLLKKKGKYLQKNSMNTNITFSRYPKMVSYLNNQMIVMYDVNRMQSIRTPLEGEDVFFSPDGNRFLSLKYSRLYVTDYNMLQRRDIVLKKAAGKILDLYKGLLANKKFYTNHYSRNYIKKKISIYNKLI